jgi:hypothetical protein
MFGMDNFIPQTCIGLTQEAYHFVASYTANYPIRIEIMRVCDCSAQGCLIGRRVTMQIVRDASKSFNCIITWAKRVLI